MVAMSEEAFASPAGSLCSLSLNPTRATPRDDRVPARVRMRIDLAPRHPARLHDRIDGRSPGSRVTARHRLPGVSQWLCGSGSPLTVAGAAAESEFGNQVPAPSPHSLFALT